MKMLSTFMLICSLALPLLAQARPKDREFRPGRGGDRGNENSAPVSSVTVGQPQYGGNGCPQGTMQVVFAPGNLSFSILFDQFVAEVTGTNDKRDVMNCAARIPIQIPPNMQMEITRVDYRGFAGLPDRAHAALISTFNFKGPRGDGDKMTMRYRFRGPVMDDYEISTSRLNKSGEPVEQSELSPCGGNFNLNIANQVKLVSREPGATVTLDSIDGSSNAIYYVNWRTCRAGNR